MKKYTIGLCLFLLSLFANAQNGLESIIVEKYYVSDANDASCTIGSLPVGSVTYRIFVDMLPGYQFKAAYGDPSHTLYFATTTKFFNNEDRGATTPTYTKTQAASNSVILDSWVSVGGACVGQLGILKSEDNGVSTVAHTTCLLNSNPATMGVSLTAQDGLIAGTPVAVTFAGTVDLANLDATSDLGDSIIVKNGAWSSLTGSVGPTVENRVLIAQLTTNGVLSFKLNIQLRSPGGAAEKYVAENPVGAEIQIPTLSLPISLSPPVVSITDPTAGSSIPYGSIINVSANASDPDGTVAYVQFFDQYSGSGGDLLIGTDFTSPFSIAYTSTVTGTHNFKVVAKDNDSLTKTSIVVSVGYASSIVNQPPVVNFTSLPNDVADTTVIINSTFTVSAIATDVDGTVSEINYSINGSIIQTYTVSSFAAIWSPSATGTYTLSVRAVDNGASVATKSIKVIVIDTTNILPVVVITSPKNDTTIVAGRSIVINVDASDSNGIKKVEFFRNGSLLGSKSTQPFSYTWTTASANIGSYTITAVATDSLDAKNTSSAIQINVVANQSPLVTITSPSNGAKFNKDTVVSIIVTATDADGTISSVDFYVDGVIVGTDAVTPYQYDWTSAVGSAVKITAIAIDDLGAKDTSSVVTIVVDESTGINDINSTIVSFETYPNPAKDLVNITFTSSILNSNYTFIVTNINGTVILRKGLGVISGKVMETLDMSNYAKGQYIIELLNSETIIATKKIIKN